MDGVLCMVDVAGIICMVDEDDSPCVFGEVGTS